MGARALHRTQYRKLCEQLRAWRLASGLTQRQLGELLGKPHSYVQKCEIGERRVDPLEFVDICRALNREPAEMLMYIERLVR